MLTVLVLSLAIWPFSNPRNQSLDWYERRLQQVVHHRLTRRKHRQTWFLNK